MDVMSLKPGDEHYQAYVGPPDQYDLMGATQFRLLCALGLRADHALLDVGCGSLRAGRLFIPYLNAGRYFGIEPNGWLIEDAVRHEVGRDQMELKRPRFDGNAEFRTDVFGRRFDFILAQSVFSHAGLEMIGAALKNFRASLEAGGVIAATFVEGEADFGGQGWVYPECVAYRGETVLGAARGAGLEGVRIPWYHPRQTWYLFAAERERLPEESMLRHLTGAVLGEAGFRERWAVPRNAPGVWGRVSRFFQRRF